MGRGEKRQKEKPLLLRDLRVHEVSNRKNECVECKDVRGGGGGEAGDEALCFCFNESKTLFFTFFVFLYVFFPPSRPCKA